MAKNEAAFAVIGISKNSEDTKGVITDSNKCEGGINTIGISHDRTRAPLEPLTESEYIISQSEFGKLMCIARMGRQGWIYDASAANPVVSKGEIIDVLEEGEKISEKEEKSP